MDLALDAVQKDGMSINWASKAFNVPYSSLWEKVKGIRRKKPGSQTRKFTDQEEDYLEDVIIKISKVGIPLNKRVLKRLVPQMAVEKGITGNRAFFSEKWYRNFLKRHPRISERISHATNRKNAREWTAETCEGWTSLLSELHIDGYLDDPEGVWNFDETAFKIAEKVSIVLAERGTKNVLSYCDGTDRELITVLAGGNAAGAILRPLVLFDGKVFVGSRFEGTEDRCWLGVNHSGVMDNETFTNYIQLEVIPAMTAEKNVIFLDGHSSHVANYELLVACASSERNIKVVRFPPGQTNRLQPMDLKVFGPVKKFWADFLRDETLLSPEVITKQNFAGKLMSKWNVFNMEGNIRSGFKSAGIFPFDPEALCKDFMAAVPTTAAVSQSVPTSVLYAPQLEELKVFLRSKFHALMESEINEALNFILQKLDGFKPSVTAADLAKKIEENLLITHPPKRKPKTDTRLQAEKGAICTDSMYMEALAARNAKKKTKAPKKGQKKPARGRVLGEITNTPTKKTFKRKKQ